MLGVREKESGIVSKGLAWPVEIMVGPFAGSSSGEGKARVGGEREKLGTRMGK
jgi:hypothetical protein